MVVVHDPYIRIETNLQVLHSNISIIYDFIYIYFAASQMLCLFTFLPLILGDIIEHDDQTWLCLRLLWNIVQICTARKVDATDVAYLRILIDDHHKLFRTVYPQASIIPKMHYLIHVPDDMLRLKF